MLRSNVIVANLFKVHPGALERRESNHERKQECLDRSYKFDLLG